MRPSRRQRTKASDSRESHRACAAHSHGRDRRAARRGLGHQEVALVRVTLTQGTRIKNGSTSTIWRPRMQRRSKKPSDPPPSSVSTYLKDVKSFCRWAKGDGILDIAPPRSRVLPCRATSRRTHSRASRRKGSSPRPAASRCRRSRRWHTAPTSQRPWSIPSMLVEPDQVPRRRPPFSEGWSHPSVHLIPSKVMKHEA